MKKTPHRIFPVHFAPDKRLVHIVVKLSDAPGSYSSILDSLRTKVNLIGTATYTLSDGTAMFSGFAEALDPKGTGEGIRELILKTGAALEAEVKEGKDGLLIDTFHRGFIVEGDRYMLLRQGELVNMFDHVASLLGSGGEALLYEEGVATGRWRADSIIAKYGSERIRAQVGAINHLMTAEGMGDVEGAYGPGDGEITVAVTECFECTGKPASRTGCNFMRGYLVGAAESIFGKSHSCAEEKCSLKDGKACEFRLTPKA